MKIIIGSRGSQLALWQANWVRERLSAAGHAVEIRVIRTSGEETVPAPLPAAGIKGLFVKEIEEALRGEAIDLAVHSLKDLPVDQPPGLTLAAVPARADPRDAFVSRHAASFSALPPGARVGTSSLRRQSQLRHLRPDIEIVPLRGNVDTRLKKLERGDCEALVLAAAGLARLGLASHIRQCFSVDEVCPAAGQGALALETRAADGPLTQAIAALDDTAAHSAARVERALLRRLGGDCRVPIGAHATPDEPIEAAGGRLRLVGVVARPDGTRLIRASASGLAAEDLGRSVADELLRRGAREILEAR